LFAHCLFAFELRLFRCAYFAALLPPRHCRHTLPCCRRRRHHFHEFSAPPLSLLRRHITPPRCRRRHFAMPPCAAIDFHCAIIAIDADATPPFSLLFCRCHIYLLTMARRHDIFMILPASFR